MAVTYFGFTPSLTSVFTFSPTLDGRDYSAVVTWNIFGQRYYINLYDAGGALVFCLPVIGSSVGQAIDQISWSYGKATATTVNSHGYPFGTVVSLNVSGTNPSGYSGLVDAFITSGNTFSYDVPLDPGLCSVPGSVSFDIDIAAGYFQTSRLVFRTDTSQFEVWS